MLLHSKTLEITAESCLVSGLSHEHYESLNQLFATFLPGAGQSLASALLRLAVLLVDGAPDTLGAAQRAVRSTVAQLKEGSTENGAPEKSCADLMTKADKGITQQQGMLQKMTASNGGVVSRCVCGRGGTCA